MHADAIVGVPSEPTGSSQSPFVTPRGIVVMRRSRVRFPPPAPVSARAWRIRLATTDKDPREVEGRAFRSLSPAPLAARANGDGCQAFATCQPAVPG